MIAIGCTGGIGSGKSTVAALLGGYGAVVVDTDAIARAALRPDGEGYAATLGQFGESVRKPDGELDRAAIAATVFGDAAARRALEAIVHPLVEREVRARLAEEDRRGRVVVIEIPLLVETDARSRYRLDGVLVVETPLDLAVSRLLASRDLDEEAVRARVEAQVTSAERLRAADFVIMNMGTFAELSAMTARAWEWIQRLLVERAEASPANGEAR